MSKQTFDQFKRLVISAAKKAKVGYLVPGADTLYYLWTKGVGVQEIITNHCTIEASRKR